MVNNKQQHTVPDCYLRAWVDPVRPDEYEPFIYLVGILDGSPRRRSPSNILKMPDVYTIFRDGVRDLSIEHGFNRWETDFVKSRKKLERGALTAIDDIAAMYVFAASMIPRQPNHIDFQKQQWSSILRRMEEVKVDPSIPPIKTLSHGPSLSMADVKQHAEDPMATWFPDTVASYVQVVATLFGLDVLVNQSEHPFISSDNPAVVTHPPVADRRFANRPRGLGSPGCEITLPISPHLALLFRHKQAGLYDFIPCDADTVRAVNHRTLLATQSVFVSDRADVGFLTELLASVRRAQSER